ncbi:MAG TPA: hypothetical protein VHR66_05630 [Gemmataceae bacterium]|jgi:hypothetical protein|nr:hypothetical protein [Gemmataceae bacterium]
MSKTTALPISPSDKPEPARTTPTVEIRQAAIRAAVLNTLGQPALLFRVAVLPLWGNHFRVNVVTGPNAASVNIPNSYFVTADDLGNILGSTPRIQKLY